MAQRTKAILTTAERIAEAKSIKSARERKARELAEQAKAEAAERDRIRAR
jgi:hypothetical protein